MIISLNGLKRSAQTDLFFYVPATELCLHLHKMLYRV